MRERAGHARLKSSGTAEVEVEVEVNALELRSTDNDSNRLPLSVSIVQKRPVGQWCGVGQMCVGGKNATDTATVADDRTEMDRIFRGIMKYRRTNRTKMVEQFVQVKNNPQVR